MRAALGGGADATEALVGYRTPGGIPLARALTAAEAVAIGMLLARPSSTDRERILASGLPARTFEVARRRVVATGWLIDRYIPDPTLAGRRHVVFALGQPFIEQRSRLAKEWSESSDAVLVWSSAQSLFGVFFPTTSDASTNPLSSLLSKEAFSRLLTVRVALSDPGIPAYFDFEGAWSRVLGRPGTETYPKPLPSGAADRVSRKPPSLEEIAAVTSAPVLPSETTPLGARAARRLARSSRYRHRLAPYITRRYFLDPTILPGYRDWTLGSIVFVHGRLRPGVLPESAFRFLVAEGGVRPFLYVTDGRVVLFAALSPPPARPDRPSPDARPSVADGLRRSLEGIEVFREGVDHLVALTNHRYERLFPPVD